MLAPGDTLDRYTVQEVLGTGGTAVVYRVVHQALGTVHALKVLSVTSPVIRDRMLTEGRVQASLRHLNVVAVTDVLDVQGAPGLLMEYIAGPSLEEAISRYKIPVSAAETLFIGVVSGVRQAHRHDLVHRDLKPANILLASSPAGFVPKVTDFGLAKVIAEAGGVGGGHTRAGVALGTPAYMAPEQIRDARKVDQRADIFALGCILFELVTKQRVYPGDDTIEIYNAVLDAEFTAPSDLVADLPARIENAIMGCLVQDRSKRIPDCDTLLEVLAGDRVWEIPPSVDGFRPELTAEEAYPEDDRIAGVHDAPPDDAPELQLAARATDGSTPAPAGAREPTDLAGDGGALGGLSASAALMDAMDAPDPDDLDPALVELPDLPPTDGLTEELAEDELGGSLGGAGGASADDFDDFDELPSRVAPLPWVLAGGSVMMAALVLFGVIGGGYWLVTMMNADESSALASVTDVSAPVTPAEVTPAAPAVAPSVAPEPVVAAPSVVPPASAPASAVPTRRVGATDSVLGSQTPSVPRPAPVAAPTPARPARSPTRPAPAPSAARPTPTRRIGTPAAAPAPVALVTSKILSPPPTATLSIAGASRGRTPSKVELAPGSYDVSVTSGDRVGTFAIHVAEGAPNVWCYDFAAAHMVEGRCP